MQRDIQQLADRHWDLLVIGAGINGACIARDAAMRGLSVAVVDRNDFVSATSSNSLRIVHGGLRYLQHLDFRRMRQSIRERSVWLRIAPHLVHCLPCMAPTIGRSLRSRSAFHAALTVNDIVGFDRNTGLGPSRRIAAGRVISKQDATRVYPGNDADRITGGACWYDAQMYHSERLVLAVLASAVAAGASVANYVNAIALTISNERVTGATFRDALTGNTFDVRARVVVNAAGPAVDRILSLAAGRSWRAPRVRLSKAMNILTRRIAGDVAVGVPGGHVDPNAKVQHGARLLFVTPWRDLSMTGTTHVPFDGPVESFRITEADVSEFLDEINQACPAARLTLADVRFVYAGLLPAADPRPGDRDIRLLQHHRLVDHRRTDGVDGLISLVGVKFTTARLAAKQVVDLAFAHLARKSPPCRTALEPVHGGNFDDFDQNLASELCAETTGTDRDTLTGLIRLYGRQYRDVLASDAAPTSPAETDILRAQTRYAIRNEMAVTLGDVVFRRTDLASRGHPGGGGLSIAAHAMAEELGWGADRTRTELAEVEAAFSHWRSNMPTTLTGSMNNAVVTIDRPPKPHTAKR